MFSNGVVNTVIIGVACFGAGVGTGMIIANALAKKAAAHPHEQEHKKAA
jgi:F0F1-type ATP synthase membrane subunit c/vacuolar-type H+-ATPase subunit K